MKNTYQAFRRFGLRLGLVVAAASAIGAFVTAAPAAATTQHWAGTTQHSFNESQSFTGQAYGKLEMTWKFSGATVKLACTQLAASGTATNPAGGGSGTLSSVSWILEGCTVNNPYCSVENGRIAFESLKATTSEEANKDLVSFVPESGTAVTTLHFKGAECPFGSSVLVTGSFVASARSGNPGQYKLEPELSHLTVGSSAFTPEGEFKLSNTSKEALILSSVETPGVPHWLTGGSEWSNLAAGKSTPYANSMPLFFWVQGKTGASGNEVEIACSGAGNGMSGSLENPSGGGAGTANATVSFGNCETSLLGCTVKPVNSTELSGVATEVGGKPAVVFSGVGGYPIVRFAFTGCSSSEIVYRGKLIATSEGNGNFNLAASELKTGIYTDTTGGNVTLESSAGEYLRLQP